jgi:hypothetical protein
MKALLFTNWHIVRCWCLPRYFLFAQAYMLKEWMFIGFGLFFFIQVIFNLGCVVQMVVVFQINTIK